MTVRADYSGHPYLVDPVEGIVYGKLGRPLRKRCSGGYIQSVGLVRGERRFLYAHVMIWESVHGPTPDGMQINHINGVKTDNRIANLELVTPAGNVRHAYRMGLARGNNGERNGKSKLTDSIVREIRNSPTMTITSLARKYRVSRGTITDVRNGKSWASVK